VPRPTTLTTKLLATALAVTAIGSLAGASTWSAFNELTANPGNSFEAGTVTIRDDDDGAAMFAGLTNLKPGDSATRCLRVTYDGSLPARVRLHGTTGGTGLASHLHLRVTRGTKSSGFAGCSDFSADGSTYVAGQPAGTVYDGTLAAYPDSWADGIVDPVASSPETWSAGEAHAYRFEVTVLNDVAAQGKTATQTFRFEAENQ
jgi:hypothetical protein